MGKIDYFYIEYNCERGYFMSGQCVIGQVAIRAKERLKINNMNIELIGKAYVHWSEGTNEHRRHYNSYENYIYKRKIIQKGSDMCENFLEPGEHIYPFELELPDNLPSSFQHHVGNISYYVKANIDIPWAIDKHCKKPFTVINNFDLSRNTAYLLGSGATGQKTLCCGPCRSDPINIALSTPKTGYVSGEMFKFKVIITNGSNRTLKACRINLIQHIKFHAKHKSKSQVKQVASVKCSKVISARDLSSWEGELKIPPVVGTMTMGSSACNIIEVNYRAFLSFDGDLSLKTTERDVSVKFTIGTVPILSEKEKCMSTELSYPNENDIFQPAERTGETDNSLFVPFYPSWTFN